MKFYIHIKEEYVSNDLAVIEEIINPEDWYVYEGAASFLLANRERIIYASGTWTHITSINED